MRTYVGHRDEHGKCQVRVVENGESRPLDPRFDLFNHSPTDSRSANQLAL